MKHFLNFSLLFLLFYIQTLTAVPFYIGVNGSFMKSDSNRPVTIGSKEWMLILKKGAKIEKDAKIPPSVIFVKDDEILGIDYLKTKTLPYTLTAGEMVIFEVPSKSYTDTNIKPGGSTAMTSADLIQTFNESEVEYLYPGSNLTWEGGMQLGTSYKNLHYEVAASFDRFDVYVKQSQFFRNVQKIFYNYNWNLFFNSRFELQNLVTPESLFVPYVGCGFGLQHSILKTDNENEIVRAAGDPNSHHRNELNRIFVKELSELTNPWTFMYQASAGMNFEIFENIDLFAEYKFRSPLSNQQVKFKEDGNEKYSYMRLNGRNHLISMGVRMQF